MQQKTADAAYADLLIVDDVFPSTFSPFRTVEYAHYLEFFNAAVLTMEGWHLWIANGTFDETVAALPIDPSLKGKIHSFQHGDVSARIAYVTFLGNAQRLLPYLQQKKLPFILQLYPGGGFGFDNEQIDQQLKALRASGLLRRVITTQNVTTNYLVDKLGFDRREIEYIYGGVFQVPSDFDFSRDKIFFGKDKNTLDLCFVAHRYGNDLRSKGYDRFIEICRRLADERSDLRFHVVGNYDDTVVPLDGIRERFTFYGRQPTSFFRGFFPRMDAILSLNKPFVLAPGAFDGFPTGGCIEAGMHGVLNCVNDPLGMNPGFVDGEDIVLLGEDVSATTARLLALFDSPDTLYGLAYANWRSFLSRFDTSRQLLARTKVIARELMTSEALIIAPQIQRSALDTSPPPYQPPRPGFLAFNYRRVRYGIPRRLRRLLGVARS